MRVWVLGVLVAVCSAGAQPVAEPAEELAILRNQVADPARRSRTRLEAARMLLGRESPEARKVLLLLLSDSSNPLAQIAVAEAIAHDGGGEKVFLPALEAMLTGEEPTARGPAARALATYRDPAVRATLCRIARDRRRMREVRLATIEAMQRLIDRESLSVLIELLGDGDPAVRLAAAQSLQRMTNIRQYGTSRALWEAWWNEQKKLPQTAWLETMIDRQAGAKLALEVESAELRERLVKAMLDIYNATSKPRRPEVLAGMLNDPISDVRLLGTTLLRRMLSENEPIPSEHRQRVRRLLYDADPRVRQAAAILEANLADARTMRLLLGRLSVEALPEVRVALVRALGQLPPTPAAYRVVLREIANEDDREATAAAEALARMAQARPLEEDRRRQAAEALVDRYRQAGRNGNGATLREALLTAIGVVGEPSAGPILIEALKDPSGLVRLSAVGGLATLQLNDAVKAIAPLMADEDRGVRQAAISALARLGGLDYVMTIVPRSTEAVEPDPAVRNAAVAAVLAMAGEADLKTLRGLIDDLQPDQAAPALRIELLRLLVDRLGSGDGKELPRVLGRLGGELLARDRSVEAVPVLAEAYRLAAEGGDEALRLRAFERYIDALLAASDPAVGRVLAEQGDEKAYRVAMEKLNRRLRELLQQERHVAVASLGGEALRALDEKLSQREKTLLADLTARARQSRLQADREAVRKLLGQVLTGDVEARGEAEQQLRAMADRAVLPLLELLREALASDEPDARQEATLTGLLGELEPDLRLYGEDVRLPEKRRWVEQQLDQRSARAGS